MIARCPKGHASEEPDYCSVCGSALGAGARGAIAPAGAAAPSGAACHSCGEARAPGARFCEVCRYDFVAGHPGPPPRAAPPAPKVQHWEVLVQVDAALDTEPDPSTPFVAAPERVVAIDRAETLLGRHDGPRDIHPELALADPGASRRHAKIVLLPDGRLTLHDLASTNGTQVNGAEVKPGVPQPLAEGDAIRIGRWTRLVVRGRQ